MIKLILYVLICSKAITAQNGDCELPDITPEQWDTSFTNEVILDFKNGLIMNFTDALNVVGIISVEGEHRMYYDVKYDDAENKIDVSTSSQFGSFEDNLVATSPYTMSIAITLQCNTGTRVLHFNQPVVDTNNHECVFNNASYTYFLPMPLPPTELTEIFPIYATDLDYSNSMLYFLIIEPIDYMTFEWVGQYEGNPKAYQASLRTTQELNIVEPVTLTLTVTDFSWVEVAYLTLIPEGFTP